MVWLVVSAALFAAVAMYSRIVLRAGRARRHGAPGPQGFDLPQVAYLAGGPARVADVALLRSRASGTVTIAPDGRLAASGRPAADAYDTAVLAAVHASGNTATIADARLSVSEDASVRLVRDALFDMGLVNPAARTGKLPLVRAALCVVPLISIAGLFASSLAGSPWEGVWIGNLALTVVGIALCVFLLWALFTRYDNLRAPLNDQSLYHLWNLVREPATVARLGESVPGGQGLGEVALFGHDRIPDAGLRTVFVQSAHVTAGRIAGDGWTEQQWREAADSRGALGAPTYTDADLAARGFAQQPYAGPSLYGGGASAHPANNRPPWEAHPDA